MRRIFKTRRILSYPERLWATDIALTTLLVSLLTYIFFLYPLGWVGSFRPLTTAFFSLILITGAITVSRNRVIRTLVFSWGLLAFILMWVRYLFPYQTLIFVANCLALFFLVLLTSHFGPGSSRRAYDFPSDHGSCCRLSAYWNSMVPGLLSGRTLDTRGVQYSGTRRPRRQRVSQWPLFYLSFVTLTTLGYGDIAAVHPVARMLVILEGVIGATFPCYPDCTARFSACAVETENLKPWTLAFFSNGGLK